MPPPWKETDGEISGLFEKPFFSFPSCPFTSGYNFFVTRYNSSTHLIICVYTKL